VTVKSSDLKRIGLLATGTEITQGEILNTDGQHAASIITQNGMLVGEHLVVDDDSLNLLRGFSWLLQHHDAIVSFGGLGPTSDDKTRFVIANLVKLPLAFNEACWHRITHRFQSRSIELTENNKQQAYFPQTATIIQNKNGSADGFYLTTKGKLIIALPGPPSECLPMFNEVVIDLLRSSGFTTGHTLKRWRLTGVSESSIAERTEKIAKKYDLIMGYRATAPYIDVKVLLTGTKEHFQAAEAIESIVCPYLVSYDHALLSDTLKTFVIENRIRLTLIDKATKGALAATLITPDTVPFITISDKDIKPAPNGYLIEGLDRYWAGQKTGDTDVRVSSLHDKKQIHKRTLFIRSDCRAVAVETICMILWSLLKEYTYTV